MMMNSSGGGNFLMRAQKGDIDEEGARLYDQRVVLRLLKYLAPYKLGVALSLIGVIIYTLATVAIPAIVAIGIDRYIETKDINGLNNLVIIFGFVLIVHYISNYSHQIILARISQRIIFDLRTDLFTHLQRLPMSFHNKNKVGSVMSRAQNDVYQLQEFLDIIVLSIADLLSLIGIIAVMVSTNWTLSLWSFVTLPLLIWVIWVWQNHARPAFLRVRIAISNVNASLAENLDGVRIVQSMNRQTKNLTTFNSVNRYHLDTNLRAQRLSSSLMPAVEMFMSFGLAATIIFGGRLVLAGALGAGQLIQFTLYIQRFFDPIRSLTQQFTQLQRAMASGARIFDLLDVEPDLKDAENAKQMPKIVGSINYENVSFAYEESKPVLHNINLKINPGETIALVGRTGAGKTTMAALISRFYDVTAGSIEIDNIDVRTVKRKSLAQQMGIVLQEPFQFSGTVLENIRYNHPEASDEMVFNAAKAVGIHDHILSLPDGYNAMMEERGGNMSLGQRQLISFARALVADPQIIILDEATASVDTQTEQIIQQAMKTLLSGRTAVVIAHRLSTIRNADQIVVMDKGEIVELGNHDELIALAGLYAKQHELHARLSARGAGENQSPSNEFDELDDELD
ncbi:MAG: hypothetical protein CMM75_10320 [Rhodospirillaceae bacterium]|nr:hypothetical protein [Rhodospirillaceae bacterium]|tara:strand:+ start:3862 stop:5736 length:1875 start_codon:yes stop_codon:yes gene_type:complete